MLNWKHFEIFELLKIQLYLSLKLQRKKKRKKAGTKLKCLQFNFHSVYEFKIQYKKKKTTIHRKVVASGGSTGFNFFVISMHTLSPSTSSIILLLRHLKTFQFLLNYKYFMILDYFYFHYILKMLSN